MNCVFLPFDSVCIQLTPYKAKVNTREYGEVLKARGPYLEWENTHLNLTRQRVHDTGNSHADTIVHVDEFIRLISEALGIHKNMQAKRKDEL